MKSMKLTLLSLLISGILMAQTSFSVNDKIEGMDQGKWYKATILKTDGTRYFVHWDGYSATYDSWLTTDKMRMPGTTTTTTTTTTNNTNNSNQNNQGGNTLDPSKYLTGDALTKFKNDMKPFNDAVKVFCLYINPKPYGLGGTTYPGAAKIGDFLPKINELEQFLKTNYPNNCNTVPEKDNNRSYWDYFDQPSIYREICENKIEIVQRVLEEESIDASWNRRWSDQFETMKTSVNEQQYMYNDYLRYLVIPHLYDEEKANRKTKYEPMYQKAGVPYNEKRVFAYQDSMLVLMQKYVDENISKCTLTSWKTDYAYTYSTMDKNVSSAILGKEPNAKILCIQYASQDYYKVYDENYYPALLIGAQKDGFVAYTLPYTNYVYIDIFSFYQEYSGGKYSTPHFAAGDEYTYFNGICTK
jgi:hypothetical protein